MKKKFDYKFDDSLGLLFKTYYGPITIEDIEASWEYAFDNNLIPKGVKGFILDYHNANFTFSLDQHFLIANFYKNHLEIFGNLKIAILVTDPADIVVPILVEQKDDGYYSKPFFTLEAAIHWVLF